MSVGFAASALAQALLLFTAGWVTGNYLLELALGRRREWESIRLPERALAAVVGGVLFSLVLMLGHMATGGRIFGNPWAVPIAAGVVVSVGFRRRLWPRSVPWVRVAAAGAILFLIYVLPAAAAGSGARTGDSPWHFGSTNQLLSGEPVPSGPAPEFGRNAYPWGFHALLATMVRLVPGSNVASAHEAMHVLIVAAIPLSAACLARLIDRRAGWAAAASVSLVGGFGWISAGGPNFSLSPSRAAFGADLVVASPNSVYELFPPAIPRELGLALLAAAGVLIGNTLKTRSKGAAVATGVAVGATGLMNVPLLALAFLWLAAGAFADRQGSRKRSIRWQPRIWLLAATTALATVGVWLLPVAISYVQLGGFLDVTPVLGVEWALPSAFGSWGLLFPIAAIGAAVVFGKRADLGPRVVIALWLATLITVGLADVRARLDWTLGSNATLLHQGRVWPAAHLVAAALAGVALTAIFDRLRARSTRIAAGSVALVMAVGSISPVFASIHLGRVIGRHEKGFIFSNDDFQREAFVFQASSVLRARDVVRVQGPDLVGFLLFQFSGARLASYKDPRLDGNDLRIRYADLALAWECRMAGSGFTADYTAMPETAAPSGVRVVATGLFRDEPWVLVEGDLRAGGEGDVARRRARPECDSDASLATRDR